MNQFSLYQYNMVHTGIYQDETFPVKYILVHESTSPADLVYILLACVKAVKSQRPEGTPIQAETIYYLLGRRCSGPRGLPEQSFTEQPCRGGVTTAAAAEAGGGGIPAAADENLDGYVVGGNKFASEKSCQSDLQLEDVLAVESCCQGCAVVILTSQRKIGIRIFQSSCI
jgi:hypothetical protein